MLVHVARHRLRNAAWAEDAVSETLVAALDKPGGYSGRATLRTWLVGILKHKVVDQIRRHTRECQAGVFEDEATDVADRHGAAHEDGADARAAWGDPLQCLSRPRLTASTPADRPPPQRRPVRPRRLLSARTIMNPASETARPPLPPYTAETAALKVRLAEDGWNSRDPQRVALAYTPDSRWRNRAEFPVGRKQIVELLQRKWARELDYRLIKEIWACTGHRIAVRFAYEWHEDAGNWFRSYGNENWAFDAQGLMAARHASINDRPIPASDRLFHWPQGRRPDDHPGLSDLGL